MLSAHAFSLLQRFQRRFFSRESCGVVLSIRCVFVIQHDEIAIRDVESAQLFQRGFGVVNVLVHHVRGTLRRPRVPDANLTYGAVFAEDVVDVLVGNAEGQIADVQNAIDLGRELFVRERWRRRRPSLRLIVLTTTSVGGGLHDDDDDDDDDDILLVVVVVVFFHHDLLCGSRSKGEEDDATKNGMICCVDERVS